jgi:hypothetical protein
MPSGRNSRQGTTTVTVPGTKTVKTSDLKNTIVNSIRVGERMV